MPSQLHGKKYMNKLCLMLRCYCKVISTDINEHIIGHNLDKDRMSHQFFFHPFAGVSTKHFFCHFINIYTDMCLQWQKICTKSSKTAILISSSFNSHNGVASVLDSPFTLPSPNEASPVFSVMKHYRVLVGCNEL